METEHSRGPNGAFKMKNEFKFLNITDRNNPKSLVSSNYTSMHMMEDDDGTNIGNQLKETLNWKGSKRNIKYKNLVKDWGLVKIYSNRTTYFKGSVNDWKKHELTTNNGSSSDMTFRWLEIRSYRTFIQLGDEIVCESSAKPRLKVKYFACFTSN